MLEPIDTRSGPHHHVAKAASQRHGMARQLATLLGDTRLQRTVAHRQFEQLGIHSGLLR